LASASFGYLIAVLPDFVGVADADIVRIIGRATRAAEFCAIVVGIESDARPYAAAAQRNHRWAEYGIDWQRAVIRYGAVAPGTASYSTAKREARWWNGRHTAEAQPAAAGGGG
jgi:hypothetical protein